MIGILLKVSKELYMSRTIELNAELRENAGKSSARAARSQKKIPAVIYGLKQANDSVVVSQNDVVRGLSRPGFLTHLFDLKVKGKSQKAIVKDIQFHPVTEQPLHIDFLRVDNKTSFEMSVPVKLVNHEKSPGIKRGGKLNVVIHRLNVVCKADNIPEYIPIDLTGLNGGDRVSLSHLKMPEGVELGANPQPTVCTVIKGRGAKDADESAETNEASEE